MSSYRFKNINNELSYIDTYLNDFARIHHIAYSSNHFTSLFSLEKLKEYYKSLILSSDISLLVFSNDIALGFIVSGENVSIGIKKFTKSNRWYLIKLLLLNPKFLFEKLRAVVLNLFKKPHINSTKFRLLSIAVDNNTQSVGIGHRLLQHFELILLGNEINAYGLSVRKENERAIAFYLKNGFEIEMERGDTLYLRKKIVKS